VARYGQAYKHRIVARLLPPESTPVEHVSREVGVSAATLERWRAVALANGSNVTFLPAQVHGCWFYPLG
jgi:transposase